MKGARAAPEARSVAANTTFNDDISEAEAVRSQYSSASPEYDAVRGIALQERIGGNSGERIMVGEAALWRSISSRFIALRSAER